MNCDCHSSNYVQYNFAKCVNEDKELITQALRDCTPLFTRALNPSTCIITHGLHYNFGDTYPHFNVRDMRTGNELHCFVGFDTFCGYPHVIDITCI